MYRSLPQWLSWLGRQNRVDVMHASLVFTHAKLLSDYSTFHFVLHQFAILFRLIFLHKVDRKKLAILKKKVQ